MAINYVALAATAKTLIDAAGRDVTLTKTDRTPADVAKPWRAGGVADTVIGPFKAVIVPFTEEEMDGTLVSRGDRKAFMSANDTGANLVEEFNILTDATELWKIVSVKTINPGATRVMYVLQLRK